MKIESQEPVLCEVCNRWADTNHEIFPGNSFRQLCIKYHVQIKLCPSCHNMAHGRTPGDTIELMDDEHKPLSQKDIQAKFCNIKNIPYIKVRYWLNSINTDPESEKCLKKLSRQLS